MSKYDEDGYVSAEDNLDDAKGDYDKVSNLTDDAKRIKNMVDNYRDSKKDKS